MMTMQSCKLNYTTEALLRAMAPIDAVIDSFLLAQEELAGAHSAGEPEEETSSTSSSSTNCWTTSSQGRFALLLASIADCQNDNTNMLHDALEENVDIDWSHLNFLPSRRYVHKLVLRYTSRLQEEGHMELEDNNLASLVCHFAMSRLASNAPDPLNSCTVTFRVPTSSHTATATAATTELNANTECSNQQQTINTDFLRIRTYPHHNDVGVAKVWEAGACLAEYILQHPTLIRNKKIVELGAGVGFTGLVAAGVVGATSVHMTDYTEACLDNMAYNVEMNGNWLRRRGVAAGVVTVGMLEWKEYAESKDEDLNSLDGAISNRILVPHGTESMNAVSSADIIIAADVVYDVNCIPDLVAAVSKFMASSKNIDLRSNSSDNTDNDNNNNNNNINCKQTKEKFAIFATTYRNKVTFGIFEKELEKHGIVCDYYSSHEELPSMFPCYFRQPRSDVRLCTMRIK